MRLVLPTAPSPTNTHFTLRSAADPKRLFTADDKSLPLNLLGGTGGTTVPGTGLYSPPPCGGIAENTDRPKVSTPVSAIHLANVSEWETGAPVSDFIAVSIYFRGGKSPLKAAFQIKKCLLYLDVKQRNSEAKINTKPTHALTSTDVMRPWGEPSSTLSKTDLSTLLLYTHSNFGPTQGRKISRIWDRAHDIIN